MRDTKWEDTFIPVTSVARWNNRRQKRISAHIHRENQMWPHGFESSDFPAPVVRSDRNPSESARSDEFSGLLQYSIGITPPPQITDAPNLDTRTFDYLEPNEITEISGTIQHPISPSRRLL